MIGVVLVFKHFLGESFSMVIRLAIYVIAGAAAYLLAIRLIQPAMYTKMLELAQMALPKFLARQN
jgi:hypothetical protein